MKPNQRGRFNNRHNGNNRSSRPQTIFRNTALESTGPCGKLRGTALQLHEKYLAAAKDALIQNDDVLAETCFQYADHYMHIQNIAIANEQAFHAQQQAQRESSLTDSPSESETTSEIDGDLKVMDLSVPVESMNSKSETIVTPTESPAEISSKPRRKLRIHQPTGAETQTDSNEVSG